MRKRSIPPNVSRRLSEPSGAFTAALRQFFDRLAEAAEALGEDASATLQRTGEVPLAIGGKEGRAVFGYTVRMGLDGLRAEAFGDEPPASRRNAASPPAAPPGPAARAPIVDVFEEGDEIRIVAELPGVAAEEVSCTLHGGSLHICTAGPQIYAKSLKLPHPVDPTSLVQGCRNGILEVRLRRGCAP